MQADSFINIISEFFPKFIKIALFLGVDVNWMDKQAQLRGSFLSLNFKKVYQHLFFQFLSV